MEMKLSLNLKLLQTDSIDYLVDYISYLKSKDLLNSNEINNICKTIDPTGELTTRIANHDITTMWGTSDPEIGI